MCLQQETNRQAELELQLKLESRRNPNMNASILGIDRQVDAFSTA